MTAEQIDIVRANEAKRLMHDYLTGWLDTLEYMIATAELNHHIDKLRRQRAWYSPISNLEAETEALHTSAAD